MAFDIYLWGRSGEPLDTRRVVEAVSSEACIREDAHDPQRFLYHRQDTSVFLSVLLEAGLANAVRRRLRAARTGALDSESQLSEEVAPGEEGVEREIEEAGEEEEEAPVEFAPVTITVPFFVPSFFLLEGVLLAQKLAEATGMEWDHALSGDTSEAPDREPWSAPSFETLRRGWQDEMRKAIAALGRPIALAVWSESQANAWWAYGDARSRLREELGSEGVEVPILQLARHQDRLKTLCSWDASRPTILPRCELVLLRRTRLKKGIFLQRRVVEDGLVPGEKIWDLLGPFSEVRKEPVDLLIFREAQKPPSQVAAALETLSCEPVENARRVSLYGVVDFDPAQPPAPQNG